MKSLVVTLLISICLISCKDSNVSNQDNILLEDKIIGSWKSESDIIQFNADGSFIDSSFTQTGFQQLNTCSKNTSENTSDAMLNKVITGTYSVKDSTLFMNPLEVIKDCFPEPGERFYGYLNSKIEMKNDSLRLHNFKNFVRTSSTHEGLEGTWEASFAALTYHSDFNNEVVLRNITEKREFKPDSGIFYQSYSYPFNTLTNETTYYYDPPEFYPYSGARPAVQILDYYTDSFILFSEFNEEYIRK